MIHLARDAVAMIPRRAVARHGARGGDEMSDCTAALILDLGPLARDQHHFSMHGWVAVLALPPIGVGGAPLLAMVRVAGRV